MLKGRWAHSDYLLHGTVLYIYIISFLLETIGGPKTDEDRAFQRVDDSIRLLNSVCFH